MRPIYSSKSLFGRTIDSHIPEISKPLTRLKRQPPSTPSFQRRDTTAGPPKFISPCQIRSFSIHATRSIIMSDEAYGNFLEKANQDTGASKATQKKSPLKTRAVDTEIPAALQGIESYYTSEADEPWEPVSLKYGGSSLEESQSHFLYTSSQALANLEQRNSASSSATKERSRS